MKHFKVCAIAGAICFLAGCTAANMEIPTESKEAPLVMNGVKKVNPKIGSTFVRMGEDKSKTDNLNVTLSQKHISLKDALASAAPRVEFIPRNADINLSKKVSVRVVNMPFKQFLEYMEGVTEYEFEEKGGVVYISSFINKSWDMATFASSRQVNNRSVSGQSGGVNFNSGGNNGGGTQTTQQRSENVVEMDITEDEWLLLLEGAKEIVSQNESNTDRGQSETLPDIDSVLSNDIENAIAEEILEGRPDRQKPYVHGLRSVGVVTAGGTPSQMRALDEYFNHAYEVSTSMFDIQVKTYDVILEHGKQKGIEWDILKHSPLGSGNIATKLNQLQGDLSQTDEGGIWQFANVYTKGEDKIGNLVSFLENYGKVELIDQPQITVRNGVPSQMYAGQELTIITDTDQAQDTVGNVSVTFDFQRLKVGVTLSVIARKLKDDRILLDVWPVISNLSDQDTFRVGDTEFTIPRISLKEFSTQVVVNSGETIHLGGLITKRMSKIVEGLPIADEKVKEAMGVLFDDIENQIQRRELVFVITPSFVEGV